MGDASWMSVEEAFSALDRALTPTEEEVAQAQAFVARLRAAFQGAPEIAALDLIAVMRNEDGVEPILRVRTRVILPTGAWQQIVARSGFRQEGRRLYPRATSPKVTSFKADPA